MDESNADAIMITLADITVNHLMAMDAMDDVRDLFSTIPQSPSAQFASANGL